MTKYRMTFELEEDCVDSIELAESRALAIAMMADSEDLDLTIINVEEVKE